MQWGLSSTASAILPTSFTTAYNAVCVIKYNSAGARTVSSIGTTTINFAGGSISTSVQVFYMAIGKKS